MSRRNPTTSPPSIKNSTPVPRKERLSEAELSATMEKMRLINATTMAKYMRGEADRKRFLMREKAADQEEQAYVLCSEQMDIQENSPRSQKPRTLYMGEKNPKRKSSPRNGKGKGRAFLDPTSHRASSAAPPMKPCTEKALHSEKANNLRIKGGHSLAEKEKAQQMEKLRLPCQDAEKVLELEKLRLHRFGTEKEEKELLVKQKIAHAEKEINKAKLRLRRLHAENALQLKQQSSLSVKNIKDFPRKEMACVKVRGDLGQSRFANLGTTYNGTDTANHTLKIPTKKPERVVSPPNLSTLTLSTSKWAPESGRKDELPGSRKVKKPKTPLALPVVEPIPLRCRKDKTSQNPQGPEVQVKLPAAFFKRPAHQQETLKKQLGMMENKAKPLSKPNKIEVETKHLDWAEEMENEAGEK